MFVSVTRLQLRAHSYLPDFGFEATRSREQAERTPGCIAAQVRRTGELTFWTMTFWEGEPSMQVFLVQSPHREVMLKLATWCDEAAVAHWSQESRELTSWDEARDRLRDGGRLCWVEYPSEIHKSGVVNVS